MNLIDMRTIVRRDLKDEDSSQRFTDDDLDRAITRAVGELSKYRPLEETALITTVSGSFDVNISALANRKSVSKVEFPIGETPRRYTRFAVYGDTLTLLDLQGDGTDCRVYYGAPHTLDDEDSTIPPHLEDLVALGATAYAALVLSQYATDKANYGGENVDRDYLYWARGRLMEFEKGLKLLKKNLRVNLLYTD